MAKNKTLELSIKIAGKVDKSLMAAINQSNGMLGDLTKTMSRVGTVGLAAMGAMAAGTIVGLKQCSDAAAEFETSMADVVKYVDGLADASGRISDKVAGNGQTFAENYGEMKKALLDLSTQIPMTADELTQLAAAAGQSGKGMTDLIKYDDSGNIAGFLKDVAMMGTAMDISADQAGNWAAKWEKAFSMDHDQIMVLADQINYLGANSATTAAEIASVVNDAASLGQVGGVDVATTAALADAVLAMGVNSGKAGTSVKRMITNMSLGASATKQQKEMWKSLGFTAEGVAKSMQSDSVGTMLSVFRAVNNLDADKQVAALKVLFGQWSIEGAAKLTGNLQTFIDALGMVNDPALYTGSMEREFVIKASTAENIDKMMANSKYALQVEMGDAFLPVKKQFSMMRLDFYNQLRSNMPQLVQIGESLATVLSGGVDKLGEALERALPYIQQGLDYLANNGPKVASTLGKIAGAFLGMKFAPGAQSLLSTAGGLLMGTKGERGGKRTGGLLNGITGLFNKSRNAGGTVGGLLGNIAGEVRSNGLLTSLLAGKNTARNLAGNAIRNSGVGQYLGGIGSALGGLGGNIAANAKLSWNMLANSPLGAWVGKKTMGVRAGLAGMGATANIYGSIIGQKVSGAVGGAASIGKNIKNAAMLKYLGFANSGAGAAIGNMAAGAGSILSSGAGVLGSIWGPALSGFGSLFAGVAPIIGIISAIIAVVSILGDHLEDIRGIVLNTFGEKGLAVFDGFIGVIQNIGDIITGLFADGGVAKALAPLRDAITGIFGDNAGAAFDGLVGILQSVMGVIGQVVNFAVTYVKPIILDIFNFITGTVVPIIVQTFTAAAPFISAIITNLGTAIMTVMTYIAQAIQAVMPFVQGIITTIMTVGSVVVPALLAGIAAFTEQLTPLLEGIRTIFGGLIDFITGVFTGNWEKAWNGVKDIFGGIFDTLAALVKAPINAVISLINTAISGINKLGITIPDWVPIIGGKDFRINIPEIPMLAKGGFTNGVSIAGEAGREAVISFQDSVRGENIATWMQAGRLLGVNADQAAQAAGIRAIDMARADRVEELKDFDDNKGGGSGGGWPGGIVFAPQITIQGNADKEVVEEALMEAEARFKAWYEEMKRREERTRY